MVVWVVGVAVALATAMLVTFELVVVVVVVVAQAAMVVTFELVELVVALAVVVNVSPAVVPPRSQLGASLSRSPQKTASGRSCDLA